MDSNSIFFLGCLGGVAVLSIVGMLTGIEISRRLQANHPLKWMEFGFPRNWMSPSLDEESSQVQGQINLLLFLLRNEHEQLNDPRLNRLAILHKCCLALVLLLMVFSSIAWLRNL